ncbi:uncharacterized protein [Ptychodera flava]|uniref:uncharacterized protein n=1 Tax=Ptychodera flava TaxID=63121 RepID=UPI00396A420A
MPRKKNWKRSDAPKKRLGLGRVPPTTGIVNQGPRVLFDQNDVLRDLNNYENECGNAALRDLNYLENNSGNVILRDSDYTGHIPPTTTIVNQGPRVLFDQNDVLRDQNNLENSSGNVVLRDSNDMANELENNIQSSKAMNDAENEPGNDVIIDVMNDNSLSAHSNDTCYTLAMDSKKDDKHIRDIAIADVSNFDDAALDRKIVPNDQGEEKLFIINNLYLLY